MNKGYEHSIIQLTNIYDHLLYFRYHAGSNTNGQQICEQMVISVSHNRRNASENKSDFSIFHRPNGELSVNVFLGLDECGALGSLLKWADT